jgi:hypothetical protein
VLLLLLLLVRAASVEDTVACEGSEELLDDVWFKLNVGELGSGGLACRVLAEVAVDGSCTPCGQVFGSGHMDLGELGERGPELEGGE